MTGTPYHHFNLPQTARARTLDYVPVSAVLAALDHRSGDAVAKAAARIIRSLEVQILSLEAEIVDAQWAVIAHAAEIQRMADHRYALAEAVARKKRGE